MEEQLQKVKSDMDGQFTVGEQLAFLEDEVERLNSILKKRDNKIKHLKAQLSESRLRRRIESQKGAIEAQGRVIERLKREKELLHESIEGVSTCENS